MRADFLAFLERMSQSEGGYVTWDAINGAYGGEPLEWEALLEVVDEAGFQLESATRDSFYVSKKGESA